MHVIRDNECHGCGDYGTAWVWQPDAVLSPFPEKLWKDTGTVPERAQADEAGSERKYICGIRKFIKVFEAVELHNIGFVQVQLAAKRQMGMPVLLRGDAKVRLKNPVEVAEPGKTAGKSNVSNFPVCLRQIAAGGIEPCRCDIFVQMKPQLPGEDPVDGRFTHMQMFGEDSGIQFLGEMLVNVENAGSGGGLFFSDRGLRGICFIRGEHHEKLVQIAVISVPVFFILKRVLL